VTQVEAARDLAAHIPGARFIEFPGATHQIMIEPKPVLAEIEEFVTGARSPESADRILATVLFIDIAGSTERAARLGDVAWRELLESFYTVERKEFARFRGGEVDNPGDGFLVTFDGPARAIRCALASMEAVKPLGLELRAGLHTGECELMVNNKVGGIAVHICARVMAKGGPGEVLGTRQHGLPDLKIADLQDDRELLFKARDEAFDLVRFDAPVGHGTDVEQQVPVAAGGADQRLQTLAQGLHGVAGFPRPLATADGADAQWRGV
jgi:class 3 adenylate cyclase